MKKIISYILLGLLLVVNLSGCSSIKEIRNLNSIVKDFQKQFDPIKLSENDIVIDGLFGTGLNKPLNGGFAGLVRFINSQPAYVISIDVPSGLMCEDNSFNVRQNIVRADLTLTVELPKLAFFLADTAPYAGEIVRVPINLNQEYKEKTNTPFTTISNGDGLPQIKVRNPFSHKGTFGHGLLIGGSYGMAGASVLAGKACLRSGIGKLTIHVPGCNKDILQQTVPEAVLSIDSGTRYFSHAESTVPFEAVAIGPGLGNFHDTANAFIEQIRNCQAPLVIDADGLNILSEHKGWIAAILSGKTVREAHKLAVEVSAYVCTQNGAMPALPRELTEQVKCELYFLKNFGWPSKAGVAPCTGPSTPQPCLPPYKVTNNFWLYCPFVPVICDISLAL